ncbi:NUDIX hydrolase [Nesterenkonia lacusekhoensis]|uniref:8-oxo-dGTP pyrophosphatase MutT (NUDIX family) n=1 Tax=Nesterenkonia lacusekhoensis TaxID=150832 RepID=A0ABS4T4G1_9MICC|nr:NUDIX hydrolase [Nesterenkonia lacusekhoensis]MBP2319341.1 8-oxo-dGTP pyrophosphatase MutT (NUDIX family) [Nesterenkonia lacusekhoensis]
MTSSGTEGERQTPLTASISAARTPSRSSRRAPVPHPPRARGALPTVEEVSAGGVVIRPAPQGFDAAIIARYNRGGRMEWCLPKGHPEGQETHEEAAVREVAEETGIEGSILTSLGSIEYWFTVPTHRVHKTVHHFLLEAVGGDLTTEKDPDHEAVDVAWVNLDELERVLSFPNERRIVSLAQQVIQDSL